MAERADATAHALREASGGPLAFTFGNWFTWTAVAVAFPALGLFLVAAAGPLAQGAYESRPALAAAHVTTLGWATMTIMGAAAQMAPVLLGARLPRERALPWQYALFTASVATVAVGLTDGRFAVVAAGGVGVNLAVWWFIGLLLAAVVRAGPKRAVLSPHIPAALVCLMLAALWGTILAANLRWVFWPAMLVGHRGLVIHLALGLGGWLGLMVVGVFYRLVPLVHGARVADSRRGAAILLLSALAIAGVAAGVGVDAAWIPRVSALLAAAALALFAAEVLHVLARRRSRAPDLNVMHWYAVVGYSGVLAAIGLGWAAGWLRTEPPDQLGEVTATFFLLGWVTQAIVGQLYKVTPFLMWYYRATIPDVLAIPRQPAPYNPGLGRAVLWLTNLGVVAMAVGIWGGAAVVVEAGTVLFAAAAFMLAYMLAYRWIAPAVTKTLAFEWRWRIS